MNYLNGRCGDGGGCGLKDRRSNVVTACSRSVVERKEAREGMESSRVVRKSGHFACL